MAEMREIPFTSHEKLFKVLILGDQSVGKSSYVQRYVQNTFTKNYKVTVGVDFAVKVLKLSDTTVTLQLWDIAGQELCTWMSHVYYKDLHGCVIMFDLSNRSTLNNAIKWKKEVDSKCTTPDGKKFPCILIANKCDLPDSERKATQAEIEQIYREYEFSGWTETSVKNGVMVDESLRYLTTVMLQERNCIEPCQNIRLAGPGSPTRKCY